MKRKDALWVMQMCRDRDARSEAEIEAFDTAIEALKNATIFSAYVTEWSKGKWKCMADCGVTECDQCGWSIEEYVGDYNFCPICGADMRETDMECDDDGYDDYDWYWYDDWESDRDRGREE